MSNYSSTPILVRFFSKAYVNKIISCATHRENLMTVIRMTMCIKMCNISSCGNVLHGTVLLAPFCYRLLKRRDCTYFDFLSMSFTLSENGLNTYAHTHTYIHTSTHTQARIHKHEYTSTHTHAHTHVQTHVHTHAHAHARAHTHVTVMLLISLIVLFFKLLLHVYIQIRHSVDQYIMYTADVFDFDVDFYTRTHTHTNLTLFRIIFSIK